MPKSMKSKAPAKKSAKSAAKLKTATKPAAAKMKKGAPAPVAAAPAKTSFMWKLLEKKEAARKQRLEALKNGKAHLHDASGNELHPREGGFAKFSGPRRKAV